MNREVAITHQTCPEVPADMQIAVPAFAVLCPARESYPWSGQKGLMGLEARERRRGGNPSIPEKLNDDTVRNPG